MKRINFEMSEIEVVIILNCLNFFLNEMEWEDNPSTKRLLSMYVDFKDSNNYCDLYNFVRDLRNYIATSSNKFFYKISNNNFFEGQKEFLANKNIRKFKSKRFTNKFTNNIKYMKAKERKESILSKIMRYLF